MVHGFHQMLFHVLCRYVEELNTVVAGSLDKTISLTDAGVRG